MSRPPSTDWSQVDWLQSDSKISEAAGCTKRRVRQWRGVYAPQTKLRKIPIAKIDWSQPSSTIAKKFRLHKSAVSNLRRLHAPETVGKIRKPMTEAQKLANGAGITLRAAYGRLHKAGLTPSGPARGRTHPMPDGLRGLMDDAAAAHEQHGGKLSPRPCDASGTNLKSLAMSAGVDRATVSRWLYRGQNPAPEHQPAVDAWCRLVIAAAERLGGS